MRNNRNTHSLIMALRNGGTTLERSLADYYKIKQRLTIQPNNNTISYSSKRSGNL